MNKVITLTLASSVNEVIYAERMEGTDPVNIYGNERICDGSALNTGLVLSNLGIPCEMYVIAGNDTAEMFKQLECENPRPDSQPERKVNVYPVDGNTRIRRIIKPDTGEVIKEKEKEGYKLLQSDKKLFDITYDVLKAATDSDYVVISGELPDGLPRDWYKDLIGILKEQNKFIRVFFDSTGNALRNGIKSKPYYIKPGLEEFGRIARCDSVEIITEEMRRVNREHGIPYVIVSLDDAGAIGHDGTGDNCYHVYSGEILYPDGYMTAGCNDSFTAGFIYGCLNNKSFQDCLSYGAAAYIANILAGFPRFITINNFNDRLKHIYCIPYRPETYNVKAEGADNE